jgi:hypothetical protein
MRCRSAIRMRPFSEPEDNHPGDPGLTEVTMSASTLRTQPSDNPAAASANLQPASAKVSSVLMQDIATGDAFSVGDGVPIATEKKTTIFRASRSRERW